MNVLHQWSVIIPTVVELQQTAKWQRVEQFVEPVVRRVVDVCVAIQIQSQSRRVRGVVGVQLVRIVQHPQHDQALLSVHYHVVMISRVELPHT